MDALALVQAIGPGGALLVLVAYIITSRKQNSNGFKADTHRVIAELQASVKTMNSAVSTQVYATNKLVGKIEHLSAKLDLVASRLEDLHRRSD